MRFTEEEINSLLEERLNLNKAELDNALKEAELKKGSELVS